MKIEVFGAGCPKCKKTVENINKALEEAGKSSEAEVVKVEKIEEIARRNIILTPAVAIDGEMKCSGKVPSVEEIRQWL
jgi:small redox-active disulfide protein 2